MLHVIRNPIAKIEIGAKSNDINMVSEGIKELREISHKLWLKCISCNEENCVGRIENDKDGYT